MYKRNFESFNVGQFMGGLQNINCCNWQEALEINIKETNASFIKFFDIFELL